MNRIILSALVGILVVGLPAPIEAEEQPTAREQDSASRIIGAALVDSKAWDKLSYLTDWIGHRLSGSAGLELAVTWAEAQFKRDGIDRVWTEKVMVPHWIRGEGSASIIAPLERAMVILALGGSVGTPPEGIRAGVRIVSGFEELDALGEEVRGKIVLFNKQIEVGYGPNGYGAGAGLRVHGASRAARLGAIGMLIRSLGTADFRLPHTGALHYADDDPQIPAAAISAEDADLIARLDQHYGEEVHVELKLGCQTRPDVESANVIAEIPGRELPEEIVLIAAHLDSWDVGTGAHDNGAGCVIVMETMRLLKENDLVPRRTIRAVLFTNEENGLRGGSDYAKRHEQELERHVAAIESDSGGFAPVGFGITAGEGGVAILQEIASSLAAVGADRITPGGGGADISPMKPFGVPMISLNQDTTHYFDIHHTDADTLDKVDRAELDRNVAAMAWMAWMLADGEHRLPRTAPETDPP